MAVVFIFVFYFLDIFYFGDGGERSGGGGGVVSFVFDLSNPFLLFPFFLFLGDDGLILHGHSRTAFKSKTTNLLAIQEI